jgi:hypothetical protein
MAIEKRQVRIFIAMAGALAAAVAAGVVSGAVLTVGHGRWPVWMIIAVLSAIMLLAIAAAGPVWRRLDDMARDAHTTAWYWGGSAGLGVGIMSAIALGGVGSPLFQGAAVVGLAQIAGYGLCWLGWWALRRPRAA